MPIIGISASAISGNLITGLTQVDNLLVVAGGGSGSQAGPNAGGAGGGAQGLVDGIRGTENWRMGNWQGYQLTNFDATIDLNEVKEVQQVKISFLQDVRAWIVMPGKLTVLTSVNGKDYKVAYMGEDFLPIEDLKPQIKTITANLNQEQVRYIRIVANQYGKLPSWHEGAGGDTHIFVDEVEVR